MTTKEIKVFMKYYIATVKDHALNDTVRCNGSEYRAQCRACPINKYTGSLPSGKGSTCVRKMNAMLVEYREELIPYIENSTELFEALL